MAGGQYEASKYISYHWLIVFGAIVASSGAKARTKARTGTNTETGKSF